MKNINSTMNLCMLIKKNNRVAIDEFFAAQACHGVARRSEEWSRGKNVCDRRRGSAVN
jgi:hypothetical protein